jgi:transposase InsO family protein
MISLRLFQIRPSITADNPRDWEEAKVQGWCAAPEDNEVGERFEPALIARLRAEIVEAQRNFDAIVRWLGYVEIHSK